MHIPRIMIAAPGSGSGKTMITCALLQILSDMKKKAMAFKCGPDYIDPMYHNKIWGIPSKNLDTYFTGEKLTRALFLEDAKDRDISVIEGVMGLFDGLSGIKEDASSYHLAKTLKVPVILVINARGMGRSVLPLIAGFLSYDTAHLVQGVILNRISKGFYEMLKPEIESNLPVRVLGFVPNTEEIKLESRYLGLKLPGEIEDFKDRIQKVAKLIRTTVDIPLLLKITKSAADITYESIEEVITDNPLWERKKIPIGIAMDEAFCFYYEDNLRLLEKMGAEIVPFSPLHDNKLPAGIQGMILGGGYPELHGEGLSSNIAMRSKIADAIKKGMPTIAECGGFMYLHEEMETESARFPMVGVIKGKCLHSGKLVRFGYIEIQEKVNTFMSANERIKGHEFHYYDSTDNGQDCIAKKPVSDRSFSCVHKTKDRWWGFPHLYYYSNPNYVRYFIERASDYGRTQTNP